MKVLYTYNWLIAFVFTAVSSLCGQGLNDHGLWGAKVLPSASVLPEGRATFEVGRNLTLYSPDAYQRVGSLNLAWNYVPFKGVEVGGSYYQELLKQDSLGRSDFHSLAIKIQVPKASDYIPDLAVGWQALSFGTQPWKHVFVSGGYGFGTRELGLRFDLSGQYTPISYLLRDSSHTGYRTITGFSTFLHLSEARLFSEFTYDGQELARNYGFWFSPFDEPDAIYEAPHFSVGGGVRNYLDHTETEWWGQLQFSASSWSEVQRAFLDQSSTPFFYLWMSPLIQVQSEQDQRFNQGYGLQQEWWVPLYEKQVGWQVTWEHTIWDRPRSQNRYYHLKNSYLAGILGEGDVTSHLRYHSPQYVLGFLGQHSRGVVLRQALGVQAWRSSYLDIGLYEKNKEFLQYVLLTQPLHPRLHSMSSWQNYIEGGYYRDQEFGAALLSKYFVNSELSTQLEFGWRGDFTVGLTMNWAPQLTSVLGFVEAGLSPHQRQSWSGDLDQNYNNHELHRFHDLFIPQDNFQGRLKENGLLLHQLDADELCLLFPSKIYCLKRFDEDLDGVADEFDKCIDVAEDPDGFEDGDGCPDEDNDQDLVPDALDKCPMVPEDKDGAMDQDGCPEDDNDGDGIVDTQDECPDQAEDKDHYMDDDGCPELDNDIDGINDLIDVCPNHPEDFDGVEDGDGCPDYQDDDQIPLKKDLCPDETEDFDGFRDDDGCPDLDNDLDEIPDKSDKCPLEREVYNSIRDQDGCPD